MEKSALLQNIGDLLGTNIDFNEDIRQMRESIINIFKENYINKMRSLIEDNRIQAKENPTKEIVLLQAIKPFINSQSHTIIDEITEAMNTIRILENFNQKISNLHSNRSENKKEQIIVDKDGVYEIDELCLNSINRESNSGQILIILLIILLFKS